MKFKHCEIPRKSNCSDNFCVLFLIHIDVISAFLLVITTRLFIVGILPLKLLHWALGSVFGRRHSPSLASLILWIRMIIAAFLRPAHLTAS